MDRKAMYKLSYGLFVLTAREGEKDNGCIINTAVQAASEPNQLSICVNKANCTHDMILIIFICEPKSSVLLTVTEIYAFVPSVI